jgi:hypothetical protein
MTLVSALGLELRRVEGGDRQSAVEGQNPKGETLRQLKLSPFTLDGSALSLAGEHSRRPCGILNFES